MRATTGRFNLSSTARARIGASMIQIALQAVPFSVLDEIMGAPNCPATPRIGRSRSQRTNFLSAPQ